MDSAKLVSNSRNSLPFFVKPRIMFPEAKNILSLAVPTGKNPIAKEINRNVAGIYVLHKHMH